jgi:dCTP deaminase
MSVIPLIKSGANRTVVSTKDDFTRGGGFDGRAVLIGNIDKTQLEPDDRESHLSYDLRVGQEYKDLRDQQKQGLPNGGKITLLPGVAVILLTEESVTLPRSMFAYIIPRVRVLQKGISNIVSKVDPGYDGHLVITVFNLGKKTVTLERHERFCCFVVHQVLEGGALYDRPAQLISGEPKKRPMHRALDWIQAHSGALAILAGFLSLHTQIFDLLKGLLSLVERILRYL